MASKRTRQVSVFERSRWWRPGRRRARFAAWAPESFPPGSPRRGIPGFRAGVRRVSGTRLPCGLGGSGRLPPRRGSPARPARPGRCRIGWSAAFRRVLRRPARAPRRGSRRWKDAGGGRAASPHRRGLVRLGRLGGRPPGRSLAP